MSKNEWVPHMRRETRARTDIFRRSRAMLNDPTSRLALRRGLAEVRFEHIRTKGEQLNILQTAVSPNHQRSVCCMLRTVSSTVLCTEIVQRAVHELRGKKIWSSLTAD